MSTKFWSKSSRSELGLCAVVGVRARNLLESEELEQLWTRRLVGLASVEVFGWKMIW